MTNQLRSRDDAAVLCQDGADRRVGRQSVWHLAAVEIIGVGGWIVFAKQQLVGNREIVPCPER